MCVELNMRLSARLNRKLTMSIWFDSSISQASDVNILHPSTIVVVAVDAEAAEVVSLDVVVCGVSEVEGLEMQSSTSTPSDGFETQ